MNQRIRELADATAELMPSGVYNTEYESGKKGVEFTEDALEKFAELIVQECCQYLNSEAERLYSLSASEHRPNFKEDFEICAEKCYDNIQGLKDHFGVEE